jgi:Winged helix DNA-binding domain
LSAIAAELEERPDGLVDLTGRPAAAEMPPPKLLGPFDPVLLGWTSREAILGPHMGIVTVNGLFRPFALVGGRAVAIWRMARGEVALEPLGRITRRDAEALEADAADVVRFLGG